MGWIETFHFIRPWWFLGVLPAIWLWLRLRSNASVSNQWCDVVDDELLHHLLEGQPGHEDHKQWYWFIGLGWLVCVIALAGPSWERRDTPTFRNVAERVIVIDLSASMNAKDVKPSRLSRVKQKVEDILDRGGEVENAIVVFAASPFVVSPLTNDAETIRSMLTALNVDIMPAQGSRIGIALDKARELLHGVQSSSGQILLFTDSATDTNALAAAATISAEGFSLSVIGVGTDEGAPIPNRRAGFLKDRGGNIVVARLEQQGLQSLATAGGGDYRRIASDESDLDQLLSSFDRLDGNSGKDTESNTQTVESWLDRGPYLMLLLLPVTALAFRRGWL